MACPTPTSAASFEELNRSMLYDTRGGSGSFFSHVTPRRGPTGESARARFFKTVSPFLNSVRWGRGRAIGRQSVGTACRRFVCLHTSRPLSRAEKVVIRSPSGFCILNLVYEFIGFISRSSVEFLEFFLIWLAYLFMSFNDRVVWLIVSNFPAPLQH